MTYNNSNYYINAVNEAEKLLDELGYDAPPVSPLEIAEFVGLEVHRADIQNIRASTHSFPESAPSVLQKQPAASISIPKKVIYINPTQPNEYQIFSIAHQIGYYLLNKDLLESGSLNPMPVMRGRELINSSDPKIHQAYHFAANLMVPHEMLDKYLDQSIPVLSTIFMVPTPVINYRLKEYAK